MNHRQPIHRRFGYAHPSDMIKESIRVMASLALVMAISGGLSYLYLYTYLIRHGCVCQ